MADRKTLPNKRPGVPATPPRLGTGTKMLMASADALNTGGQILAESQGIAGSQMNAQIREGATVSRQQDYDVGSFSRQLKEVGTSLQDLNKAFREASVGLNASTQENITMMKVAMRNTGNDPAAQKNSQAAVQSTFSTAYYGGMNRGQAMQNIDSLSQSGMLGSGSRATGGTAMSIQSYNTAFTAAGAASGGFGTRADQYGMTAAAMMNSMAQRGAQGISGSQVTTTLGAVNLAAQQNNNAMLHNVVPGAYAKAEQSMMANATQGNPMLMAGFSKARSGIRKRNQEGLDTAESEAARIQEQIAATTDEGKKTELQSQLTAKKDEAKTFRTRLDTLSAASKAGPMGVQAYMETGDIEANAEIIQGQMRQFMGKRGGDPTGMSARAIMARSQVAQANGLTTQEVTGMLQTQAVLPEVKARQAEAAQYMSTSYQALGESTRVETSGSNKGKTVRRFDEKDASQMREAWQGTFRAGTFEDLSRTAQATSLQTGQSAKFTAGLKEKLDEVGTNTNLTASQKLAEGRRVTLESINQGVKGGEQYKAGGAANSLQATQANTVVMDNAFKTMGQGLNNASSELVVFKDALKNVSLQAANYATNGAVDGPNQNKRGSGTLQGVVAEGATGIVEGGAATAQGIVKAPAVVVDAARAAASSIGPDGNFRPSPRSSEFGGPVFRGLSGTVGERGPEIFTPKQDGFITTNKDSSSISDMFKSSLGAINQAFTGGLSKSMKDKPPSTPIPAAASADGSTAPVGGGDDGKDFLGKVAATFESGGDPGRVSTGQGDAGGKSFGAFQLSSKTGSLEAFLKQTGYIKNFEGMNLKNPGKDVEAQWKKLAENPEFVKAQSGYAKEKYYDPYLAMLKKSGIDLSGKGRAVDELILSTANQYGAGSSVLLNAFKGKNVAQMSPEEIITTAQQYKAGSTGTYFSSSSENVRAGVRNRIAKEQAMLLGMTKKAEGGDIVRGEPTLVGEKGPEMFVPNSGGSVSSSAQTKKLLEAQQDSSNSGGNKEVSGKIIVEFVSDGQKVGEAELKFNGPDQRVSINPRQRR